MRGLEVARGHEAADEAVERFGVAFLDVQVELLQALAVLLGLEREARRVRV